MSRPRRRLSLVPALLLGALFASSVASGQEDAGKPAGPAADPAGKVAAGVEWKSFHPTAFRRAQTEGRLVLLVLDVPWSESVAAADREVWAHPDVARVIREGFVPIRERADLRGDLRRRYPAEGWPAVSILLPDGTPLVYDTEDEESRRRVTSGFLPASDMRRLLEQSSGYWRVARERAARNASTHLGRMRETALPESTALRDTAVWGIASRLQTTFDAEARYYGGPPRIPRFDLLELALTLAGEAKTPWETAGIAALQTLDENLVDEDGGVMRMALQLDWSDVQREKLLDRSARHLDLLTQAYRRTGRRTLGRKALRTAAFMNDKLSSGDAFANALCASCPGGRDEAVLTGPNARAAAALIRAGAALGERKLLDRGLAAARFLKEKRYAPGRLAPTAVENGRPHPPDNFVLDDQASLTHAFLAAAEATGDPAWLEAAGELASAVVANFKSGETSALGDVIPNAGAPTTLRFAVYPQDANAEMARALLRLGTFTGERRFRDAARAILQGFAGSYDESPLRVAAYGTALYELFNPSVVLHVVASKADERGQAMREAGLRSPFPYTLVRTWDPARDAETIRSLGFTITADAGAWASHGGMISKRVGDPGGVPALINDTRQRYVTAREQRKERERDAPKQGKDR